MEKLKFNRSSFQSFPYIKTQYKKLIYFIFLNKSWYIYRFAILRLENQHLGGQALEEAAEMDLL